ncbi:MAG: ACT domain-containing protein [Candidatus Aminicenantales bacterium]
MDEKREFRMSLPNEPGQLARVAGALGSRGINIVTVAAIGAANPVVSIVTDQEEQTREVLKELDVSFEEIELLTAKLPHKPGELGRLAKNLGDAGINIDSIYLLEESLGEVKIAFTVSDLAKARDILSL